MIKNKQAKMTLVGFFLCSLALGSCLKETEGTVSSNSNVTYEANVKNIMIARGCEGCHSAQSPVITSYTGVKDNYAAVLGSIQHAGGFSRMPKGRAKLPDAEIELLQDWKAQGFKEK